MSQHVHQSAVTVLGLGPMGRALAGAFLDAGIRTTVWNRTPGKDQQLTERGAYSAPTPESAVAASEVTVICVVNYDAADAVVRRDAVAGALRGRTLVNLTADTPGRARSTAAWATEHGIGYLDGAIMTPTTTIGTPAAAFLHSGPEELYRRHSPRPHLTRLPGVPGPVSVRRRGTRPLPAPGLRTAKRRPAAPGPARPHLASPVLPGLVPNRTAGRSRSG
ncbi:NAD(P)-dependent oxidoreductase [Microbispora hainanensis]|uniref:NAD(P)-binding domain-containing protein n=1 Tax=Microbispora hainanensis TaxID=568844 RepID=A0ABZ1SLU3_9ACTN|nr:NAD(P)-binding domain-containing protein [Microbispora hainanensis]